MNKEGEIGVRILREENRSKHILSVMETLGEFFFKFIYLTYLFGAALGLHCYARAFSSCSEWGLLFVAVRGLLIAVASLVAEHRL